MKIEAAFAEAMRRQAQRQNRTLTPVNLAVAEIVLRTSEGALRDVRDGRASKSFKVVSAPTGSSKTNSAVAYAIAKYLTDPDFTCAFIVEEVTHANEIYSHLLAEIPRQHLGVWTSYHDQRQHQPSDSDKYGFLPDELTTLEQAAAKPIAIFTHRKWLSEIEAKRDQGVRNCKGRPRDVLFIDEQPSVIQIIEKTPADILKVRDQVKVVNESHEWVQVLTDVAKRMEELFTGKGDEMTAVHLIEVLESLDFTEAKAQGFWTEHHGLSDSSGFMEGIKFLHACSLGYCFLSRRSPMSFVAYLPTFEPEPNQVILDATADISGLYPLLGGKLAEDVPKIDYSNLSINHIQAPREFKSVRKVVDNRSSAISYANWIKQVVMNNTKAGDRVLVVIHKAMVVTHGLLPHSPKEPDVYVFPDRVANVIWWGSGIGSNHYKDCTEVFMFSEFYQPRRVTVAKTLGAKKVRSEEAGLNKLNGRLNGDYLSVQEGDVLRWTKQLACRGNVRNVDQDGVCGSMRLHTTMDYNRLIANLHCLFPNARTPSRSLEYQGEADGKSLGRQGLIDLLSTTSVSKFSFKELESLVGIKSYSIRRELDTQVVKPVVAAYGWAIVSAKELSLSGKALWLVKNNAFAQ